MGCMLSSLAASLLHPFSCCLRECACLCRKRAAPFPHAHPSLPLCALGNHRCLQPESLAPLPRLLEMRIADNCLRSLAHIASAPALCSLHAGSNRLCDLGVEAERLVLLAGLTELVLTGNLMARKQVGWEGGWRCVRGVRPLPVLYIGF